MNALDLICALRIEVLRCFTRPSLSRERLLALITQIEAHVASTTHDGEIMRYERWAASR